MHLLLHMIDDWLNCYHDRLFNPTVEIRVIKAKLCHIVNKREIFIGLSIILFVLQRVWNILFLSYNQTEGTDYPENSIIYFFVKIIVDPGCKVILINEPLISKFLQFTDQPDA
jgi:hypothetical protein